MKRFLQPLTTAALPHLLLTAGLLLGAPRAFGQERGEEEIEGTIQVQRDDDLESLAKITPNQAQAAARARVSGATAEEAELENENGSLVYAVDLERNGTEMEVLVDAGNGSVLRVEEEGEEAENDEKDEDMEEEAGEEDDERYEESEEMDEEGEQAGEEGEQAHAMRAELPQAVEQAFHEKYPNAEIVGTDREHEHGSTFYEVESRDGGMSRDLLYRVDGRVYEIEEQVKADALPEAVRKALDERGRIVKVERVTREGATEYEAAVREGGRTREVVLNADGQVIEGSGGEE